MKVQQNARAEVTEMKTNAITKRQFKNNGDHHMVRDVVNEYEAKIKQINE
jgi:hypothetical protein